MKLACSGVLLTTIVYHGAHTAGHEQWANRFMGVDVGAVAIATGALLWSTPPSALSGVCWPIGLSLALWLPSFGPLKGIPYNPILSICHLLGVVAHSRAMADACPASWTGA